MSNYVELREICDFQNGFAFKSSDYIEKSNTLNCRMSNIRPGALFDAEYNKKYLPDSFAEEHKSYLLKDGDLVIAMTDMAGDPKILGVPAIVNTKGYNMLLNQRVGKLIIRDEKKYLPSYVKYALSNPLNKEYYKRHASGGLQINIGKDAILNIKIPDLEIDSQRKLIDTLDNINDAIEKKEKEIELLDELIDSKFDSMFKNYSNNTKLCDILIYEQPTKYIVESDNYSDEYKTPVLTPGKSFILGYTNETEGIFPKEKLPVILFDDFTTSTQYVDFPFKVKSSASKVLHCNHEKATVFYALYLLRNLDIDSSVHKRYWISEFSNRLVKCPEIEKQLEFEKIVLDIEEKKKIIRNSISELKNLRDSILIEKFGGANND